ncbi:MAG TPA: SUMF1/EgtB/PvdO family nonheme iron enzyme, partial [Gemmataceae bacterium]|nr:SUMF1/EgtB/PvdO family nonheme iron enzyme [Gemmataceae bacterium]
MNRFLLLGALAVVAFAGTFGFVKFNERGAAPPGMVWIPGGEFTMGSDNPKMRDAQPLHRIRVDGFWMDQTAVTNEQFQQFVETTGYVTVAERTPQAKDFPGAPAENLVAGAVVFAPPK